MTLQNHREFLAFGDHFWPNVSYPVGTGFRVSQTWFQGLVPPNTSWVTLSKSLTTLVSGFLSAKWGQLPFHWTVVRTKGDSVQKEHSTVPGTQCALKYTCVGYPISILFFFLDPIFSKWQCSQQKSHISQPPLELRVTM